MRRPYGLLIYLLTAEPDTYGRLFSTFFNLLAISSGSWSSMRWCSMNARRFGLEAIFLPSFLLALMRTCETCLAYSASYFLPFLLFRSSYQMPLLGRLNVLAMSDIERPFSRRISISLRSADESRDHFLFFSCANHTRIVQISKTNHRAGGGNCRPQCHN